MWENKVGFTHHDPLEDTESVLKMTDEVVEIVSPITIRLRILKARGQRSFKKQINKVSPITIRLRILKVIRWMTSARLRLVSPITIRLRILKVPTN